MNSIKSNPANANSSKVEVYIVGAGAIAAHHARSIPSETARLAGVVEIDQQRRERFLESFPGIEGYASITDFVSEQRTRHSLVIVATPPPFHFDLCRDLLSGRYHVLCEKPLTTTAHEARVLSTMAREAGVRAGCCESRFLEFEPVVVAAEIISRGDIGEAHHVEQKSTRRLYRNGIEYQPESRWFLNRQESGGGPVLDWGVYDLAVVGTVVGGFVDPVVRYARVLRDLSPVPPELRALYDVEEYAYAVSDVTTNDGRRYSFVHERGSAVHGKEEHYLRVLGARGGIEVGWLPGAGYVSRYWIDASGQPREERHEYLSEYDVHALPVRDMIDAIRSNRDPLITFERATQHIEYVNQVYEASDAFASEGVQA